MWAKVEVAIDNSMPDLCRKPYPLHPKGCPNYGMKAGCPPQSKFITRVLRTGRPIYAIYNKYDIARHLARMRRLHPDWTSRQLHCCLYWQGTARKQLRKEIIEFKKEHPDMIICHTPEACGVNVTATMASIGIELEWPPENWAYQVVLAGYEF